MKSTGFVLLAGCCAFVLWAAAANAVTIETVPVGNVGNTGEGSGVSYGGWGPDRICGAVDYQYNIGKYEVTAGQYTEFLNAVATVDDPYGLYNTGMTGTVGCNIERSGSSGSYSYSIAADWANRPVSNVCWGDAARFTNWLTNGQPIGALTGVPNLDASLTENGSYALNGAMTDAELMAVGVPNATQRAAWSQGSKPYYLLPSEDEWYKAAYHKNDGDTNNYFDYPTSSDTTPSNDLVDPDPGNNATFHIPVGNYTIGSPYWRTEVGAHENSDSPYGTFDMGGNVEEWNDANILGIARGLRGEGFGNGDGTTMLASSRDWSEPASEGYLFGFRVSEVPEPATLALLGIGGLALIRRRRK